MRQGEEMEGGKGVCAACGRGTKTHMERELTGINRTWVRRTYRLGGEAANPPGRPAYAQPLSPSRQAPASMASVTDNNRPKPLWQPPPTARLTASEAPSEVPSLLMHPWMGWGAVGCRGLRAGLSLKGTGSCGTQGFVHNKWPEKK